LNHQCNTFGIFKTYDSDPILAMAVINAFGPLVKTRHTLASKIINAFLAVDIVSIPQTSPDPLKAQLQLRSVSKTLRIQLSHFLKYLLG
jgi:Symplekin/PTA1 N-terminal